MTPIKCYWLDEVDDTVTQELVIDGTKVSGTYPVYRRRDTGSRMLWHEAPVGAMRRAHWIEQIESARFVGPDGLAVQVKIPLLPDGSGSQDWVIDGPTVQPDGRLTRSKWTRTGFGWKFTVTPAVWINQPTGFHGRIRDGYIVAVK